jgi:ATP-dependent DNA helicase RecQ
MHVWTRALPREMASVNADLETALRTSFGFPAFRPGQAEAIRSLLGGRHTLVVMPTGAGKSLIYQLAALENTGTTVVISPLIALMQDQIAGLTRHRIPATFINSSVDTAEQNRRLKGLSAGDYRLVYVAPERLRNRPFLDALSKVKVDLLAVDEAHCISQWGHDFRPDYLRIGAARARMGNPITAALTATATPRVQDDIVRLLSIPSAERIITGFNRPNLFFQVRYASDANGKLHVLKELLTDADGGVIVYVGTRRDAEEVADFARTVAGLDARHYHGGMDADVRTRVQNDFLSGGLPVIVATNAFGMGVDRPDVRIVAHYTVPSTLEAYYQEAGRGGRDGDPAQAVLIYSPQDRALQEYFIQSDATTMDDLRELYRALQSRGQPEAWATSDDLSIATGFHQVKVRLALAQLETGGSIERLGDDGPRMLIRIADWDDAAMRKSADDVESRRKLRLNQLNQMIAYAESSACRRRILLTHFGDHGSAEAPDCCDNCRPVETATGDADGASTEVALTILDALSTLRWEIGQGKLALMLKGSRAKELRQFGYDKHPGCGSLSRFSADEIKDLIRQLITGGYIKPVGGSLPVLRLSPQGASAVKARSAINLRLPSKPPSAPKQSKPKAEDTVKLTADLFAQGLSPSEIAKQRELTEQTIYQHLARLIAEGRLPLTDVVPEDVVARIRAAIGLVGDVSALSPIKAILPDTISYGHIRCVVESWKVEKGIQPPRAKGSEELVERVVQLGNDGSESGVEELIAALENPSGNVRRLAASALGKIGDACAVDPLMQLLECEALPQVRQYAVKALGSLGDPSVRSLLEAIAADDAELDYTRTAARLALKHLGRSPRSKEPVDDVAAFLSRPHPKPLKGPWHSGWALDFHSRFDGDEWSRGLVGELVNRLKYEGDTSAVQPLVDHIMDLIAGHPDLADVDGIVPMPPSTVRPFDPVKAVADELGSRLSKKVGSVLVRVRQTAPQKEMHSLAQKRANVNGAFVVRAKISGRKVLLLDDLYDSGMTLEAAFHALMEAGAIRVCVLTLTRTIHSDA